MIALSFWSSELFTELKNINLLRSYEFVSIAGYVGNWGSSNTIYIGKKGKFGTISPCFSNFLAQNTPNVPSFGVMVGPSGYKWYFTEKSQIFFKIGRILTIFIWKICISQHYLWFFLRITFFTLCARSRQLCWSAFADFYTRASFYDYLKCGGAFLKI